MQSVSAEVSCNSKSDTLTRSEAVDHRHVMNESRSSPAFRRPEHNHGPSRLGDRAAASSSFLNGANLSVGPVHGSVEVFLDFDVVLSVRLGDVLILDDAALVAITGKQRDQLFVVHRAGQRTLADLKAVDVEDRNDRARLLAAMYTLRTQANTYYSRTTYGSMYLCACQAVAVGPVSLSPSPIYPAI